eukprot:417432_1
MGLHSLLISAMDGTTLLSRFYPSFASENGGANHNSKESSMQAWEEEVQKKTRGLWMTADHTPQVAIGGGGVIIAFRKVDDLTIFLSSKDHNEILLAEALNTITVILKSFCEDKGGGGRVTEAKLQLPNIHGKFCVCLDELMPGGILESMDPDDVLAMSKLRPTQK